MSVNHPPDDPKNSELVTKPNSGVKCCSAVDVPSNPRRKGLKSLATMEELRLKRLTEASRAREVHRNEKLNRTMSADTDGPTAESESTDQLVDLPKVVEVDTDTTPFQVVVNRSVAKKIKRQEKHINEIRHSTLNKSKGLFKVRFYVSNKNKESFPFPSGSILGAISELRRQFPEAAIESSNGVLQVWVNTVEDVDRLKTIQELATLPVLVRDGLIQRFVGKISGVDKGFTDEEILSSLKGVGVVSVKREFWKSRSLTHPKEAPTDRVLLHFMKIPPEKVFLAGKEHLVILNAGRPTICFNCQRIGHISANCVRPKTCMRCGGINHLAAQCQRPPRCVNCHQMHPSWSASCPVRILAVEERKVLLEARLRAHVGHEHRDALITERVRCDYSLDKGKASAESSNVLNTISYADAVAGRSIVIKHDGTTQQINLPKTRLPQPTRVRKTLRKGKGKMKKPTLNVVPAREKCGARELLTGVQASKSQHAPKAKKGSCSLEKATTSVHSPQPNVSSLEGFLLSLERLLPLFALLNPSFTEACRKMIADAPSVLKALSTLKPLLDL